MTLSYQDEMRVCPQEGIKTFCSDLKPTEDSVLKSGTLVFKSSPFFQFLKSFQYSIISTVLQYQEPLSSKALHPILGFLGSVKLPATDLLFLTFIFIL